MEFLYKVKQTLLAIRPPHIWRERDRQGEDDPASSDISMILKYKFKHNTLHLIGDDIFRTTEIGDFERVVQLLKDSGTYHVNLQNAKNETAVHKGIAAKKGHLGTLNHLLDPSHHLLRNFEHIEIAELLIEKGASPEFGCQADTILPLKAARGDESEVTRLLDEGVEVDSKGGFGFTAL
ncbi:hypothetical protein VM1G_10036 [Cytospora mali]|uniref:Uncharacterized protein n=1 Tax=Cytospora mali TaxID=578113 RepID=A0A194WCQ6_CYTMA|nr:hypothetical protein VM1G_10036 [Valsa mali]